MEERSKPNTGCTGRKEPYQLISWVKVWSETNCQRQQAPARMTAGSSGWVHQPSPTPRSGHQTLSSCRDKRGSPCRFVPDKKHRAALGCNGTISSRMKQTMMRHATGDHLSHSFCCDVAANPTLMMQETRGIMLFLHVTCM